MHPLSGSIFCAFTSPCFHALAHVHRIKLRRFLFPQVFNPAAFNIFFIPLIYNILYIFNILYSTLKCQKGKTWTFKRMCWNIAVVQTCMSLEREQFFNFP